MPPYQGGGDMIASVTFEKTTYADLPNKFEAGTPNIAGGVGFGAAIEYLSRVDFDAMIAYEQDLLAYATEQLSGVPGLRIIGTAERKGSVISFVLSDAHPHGRGDEAGCGGDCGADGASLLPAGDGSVWDSGDGAGVDCGV